MFFWLNRPCFSVWAGLFFLFTLLIGVLSSVPSVWADKPYSKILNVKIPRFNDKGFISWELHASSLTPIGNEVFLAAKPILYLFSNRNLESKVMSDSGKFSLKSELAEGEGEFNLEGSGFFVKGIDWKWKKTAESGTNQMIFQRSVEVNFNQGLRNLFVTNVHLTEGECERPSSENNLSDVTKPIPTIAHADYLEFLSVDKEKHRFLLDGNVSVEGNNIFLTCDKMEVLFSKDANSSNNPVGAISFIQAQGSIKLKQQGRISYAENMTLDVEAGTVLLSGQARVVDEQWGVASGAKIILEKGRRLARVIANEGGRSRLELPSLPDFGFPKRAGGI